MRIVIVGAGIAGLAAALRLGRLGHEPVVLERAPARRRGGYALHLFGHGYAAAEALGLLPALTERHCGALTMTAIRPDGRPRFTVPGTAVQRMLGGRNLNLLRGDIEEVLFEAADAEIRFGVTVDSITQRPDGVHLALSDGTTLDAELLIGADGRHSKVRELAFGPEERFRQDLDHVLGAFVPAKPPRGVPDGTVLTMAEPGRTMNLLNLGHDRIAAFFAYGSADPAAELALSAPAALTRTFGPIAEELLDGSESVFFDRGTQISVDRWSSGRVVLVGDSAWQVSVFAAYGASLAIAGGHQLGGALSRTPEDIPAALRTWEAELRPEVQRRQRSGRRRSRRQLSTGRLRLRLNEIPLRVAALI